MAAPLAGFKQARPFVVNHRAQRICCQASQHRQLGAGASGLALLLSAPRAWADGLELPSDLTYPSFSVPDLPSQLPTDSAGIAQFISDYPLLLPAAAGLVIVPALISQLNGGRSKVQGVSAARVLELLSSEDAVAIIDIRSKESAKQYGDPDLSSVRKSLIRVPFSKTVKGEYMVDDTFATKFGKLRAITEDITVILLDSFGKEAPQAGEQVASLVDKVYYVQDGAEGPRGWKAAELPWREPGKLSFDLSGLKNLGSSIDSFAEDFKSAPTAGKALLGVGALVGGALLIFQEIDTALEVAGIFAAGQFALRRLLFAEDRKKTQAEIKELVDEKIAVKDVPKDLRKLADKVLEAEKEATPKIEAKAQELKEQTKDVREEVGARAREVVGSAKEAQKEASAQVEDTVNVAQDTIDLNGAGAPTAVTEKAEKGSVTEKGEKEEAREWISNWRSKN